MIISNKLESDEIEVIKEILKNIIEKLHVHDQAQIILATIEQNSELMEYQVKLLIEIIMYDVFCEKLLSQGKDREYLISQTKIEFNKFNIINKLEPDFLPPNFIH